MGYEFDGVRYEKLRDMRETRRARYVGLFEAGMNFTRTAHAGGGSVFALAIAVAIVVLFLLSSIVFFPFCVVGQNRRKALQTRDFSG